MSNLAQIISLEPIIATFIVRFLPNLISALLILGIGIPLARYLQRKCIKKIHGNGDPTLKREIDSAYRDG